MRSLSPPFRIFLAALFLLSFSGPLLAADATVSWTLATQRIDGTALPANQIAATRVQWGTCSGTAFGTQVGTRDVAAPATSTVIAALAAGTWCFRAYTVDTGGLVSDASAVASRTFQAARPQAPSGLTVSP